MTASPEPPILLPAPRRVELKSGISKSIEQGFSESAELPPQGYQLSIQSDGVRIIASDKGGHFYAQQTLAQLHRQYGPDLPCMEIHDCPDFPVRGVMLDISRDKVPSMTTLFGLVDSLSEWKINQLQLYTEHTFAYAGHEEVWRHASPLTGDEIRQLDEYCKRLFIELVPNQNSFGHMERWLKYSRYLPLAEAPDGAQTPWGFRWQGPFSLCPTDPRAIELLRDLYGQLLPHFSSWLFNVGCDETFDIGQGRSKAECDRRGVARVYLDFLHRVNELASVHGKQMMFWGDIILHHPDLISEIPKGIIALNWGYESGHPFEKETSLFQQAGVPFYVCPGTSSWCSIAGRTENMLGNQRAAAEAGLKHGAAGFLNTDWGDYGHLQYLPTSYAGLAAGAAMSWCLETNRNLPLADVLNRQIFCDDAQVMGRIACDLGNVYKATGKLVSNRSALFNILVPTASRSDALQGIQRENLDAAEAAIDAAMTGLENAKMNREDATLIQSEFANAAAMLRHACRRGRWKLDGRDESDRAELAAQMDEIIQTHRQCWLARNRPGGLEDSMARLDRKLAS